MYRDILTRNKEREKFIDKYFELYNKGDALFKEYNVCDITDTGCNDGNFCCNGCVYLDAKGCTVRALWCKLWICGTVTKTAATEFLTELSKLQVEATQLKAYYGRVSLAENLQRFDKRGG